MGRPTNEDLKGQSMLEKIMEKVEFLTSKVSNLEAENQTLKQQTVKGKKFKITGMGNQVNSEWAESLDSRNKYAEEYPEPIHIQKELGFKGIEDGCPYCNSQDQHNLLDLNTRSGRYQCRLCSKSWDKALIGLPYVPEMENGQFDTKWLGEYVLSNRKKVA